jgi:predicted ABC-type ATPase
VLIGEIRAALRSNASFGWESTLAGRSHAPILRAARDRGYEVELHYLSVPFPEICVERVARRVREGGHSVPVADINRRFHRSLHNLVDFYLPLADRWTVWDSTGTRPKPLLHSSWASAMTARSILLA